MGLHRGMKLALQVGAVVAVMAHLSGCDIVELFTPRPLTNYYARPISTPISTPTEVADSQGMILTAAPIYRLVLDPALANVPSRLMVVQVRVGTIGDAALSVAPADVTLTLPDGEPARILDRARAIEVLHRTMLASAGTTPTSGVSDSTPLMPAEGLAGNLLSDGVFTNGQTLHGLLVVDTGAPLVSLDGASVQVTAYRLSDSAPVVLTYQLASVPPTAEAH